MFAELFGKNIESEVTCVGKVWTRVCERIIFCDSVEKFVLPAGVNGKVSQQKQGLLFFYLQTFPG